MTSHAVAFAVSVTVAFVVVPGLVFTASADSRVEVVSMRTATSQTFRNSDGTYTTAVYAHPINYEGSDGSWHPISQGFARTTRAGYAWQGNRSQFRSFLQQDTSSAGFLTFDAGSDAAFTLSPDFPSAAEGSQDGNELTYPQTFIDADLAYTLLPDELKESIILHDSGAPSEYEFRLVPTGNASLSARYLSDGSVGFFEDGAGLPAFILQAPVVSDSPAPSPTPGAAVNPTPSDLANAFNELISTAAAGDEPAAAGMASLGVQKNTDGTFSITVRVDWNWLHDPSRVFPVVIDPTISTQPDVQDGYWNISSGGAPNVTSQSLFVGQNGSSAYASGVVFDLGGLPSGATVSQASVNLSWQGCNGTCPASGSTYTGQVTGYRITSPWSTTTDWSSISTDPTNVGSYSYVVGTGHQPPQWQQLGNAGLASAIQQMLNGSLPNYGFLIRDENNGTTGLTYASSRNGNLSVAPYLSITWSANAPQLFNPTHLYANGAQLAWARYADGSETFDHYEIHRSLTPNFTPSASTWVATLTDPTSQTYRDTTARPGTTFYYEVVAYTNGGANSYSSNEVAAALPPLGQAQVTIQPGVDGGSASATSISSSNTCANNGASQSLPVDATDRSLLSFDLRQIPNGATVTAATMSLFTFSTPAASLDVHRLLGAWKEGTATTPTCNSTGATWLQRIPTVKWAAAGGDYDLTPAANVSDPGGLPRWDSWDVTSLVNGWLNGAYANLGVLIKHHSETGAPALVFASNDYTTSLYLRPKLTVTYSDDAQVQAPHVAIGAPGANSEVSGATTITAGASDDGRVVSVQFQLDGANLGGAITTAPYSYAWDTTTASRGQHTLTAIATDDAGNTTTTSPMTVTVANSAAPTTAISTAAPGSTDVAASTTAPVGTIVPYAGATIPSGWLLADGTCYGTANYPQLFDVTGYSYGGSADSFCVPDLRARVPLGAADDGSSFATLGASGGAFASSGTVSLPSVSSPFNWTETPANPVFQPFTLPTWYGAGAFHAASSGQYTHSSLAGVTFSAQTESGTTLPVTVNATASAVTPKASYTGSSIPYRVVRYIVKADPDATNPCAALWASAANTAAVGTTAADGSHASGDLAGCLDSSFAGSVPDLGGDFAVGQAASGPAASLNASGGQLTQNATTVLDPASAVANVAPTYSAQMTLSSPAPVAHASGVTVWQASGATGLDPAYGASAGKGSDDGAVASSATYAPSLTTNVPPGQTKTSSGYAAPYVALRYLAYEAASYDITAGTITPYAGSNVPGGWLIADGHCGLSSADYPELWAAIGTSYGGSGQYNFCLPDLRERVPIGTSANGPTATLGATGGSLEATPTIAFDGWTPTLTVPAHTFSWSIAAHTHPVSATWCGCDASGNGTGPGTSVYITTGIQGTGSGALAQTYNSAAAGAQTVTATVNSATINAAAPVPSQTVTLPPQNPPYQVVNYLINVGASPARPGDWTVSASASDDFAVTKIDFLVDGLHFATRTSPPYQAVLHTLFSPSLNLTDGSHTLTTKAYDADGHVTTSAPYPITINNSAYTEYKAGISSNGDLSGTSAVIPSEMRYDPNASSQDAAPLTVKIQNNSNRAWSSADVTMRVRWLGPDGNDINAPAPAQPQSNAPIGITTAFAGSSLPWGWLYADGSCYSTADYPDLFSVLGYTYGGNDGTFCLPDLRGRLPLGQTATGTGSTRAESGGAFSSAGTLPLNPFTPTFSWTENPANPAFQPFTLPSWFGNGSFSAATTGTSTHSNVGPVGFSAQTESGTAQSTSASATGNAVTSNSTYATSSIPYRVVRYVIKASPTAANPCGALWTSAAVSTPSGATTAAGTAATGQLASCLDPAYEGTVPNLAGFFPVGQTESGLASVLDESNGSLVQTATVTLPGANTQTPVTIAPYSDALTISSPAPTPSFNSVTVQDAASGHYGFDPGSGIRVNAGSDDGSTVTSSSYAPTGLTTDAPPDQIKTATFSAPFVAMNYIAYASTSYSIAAGTVTPYLGSTAPSGWLVANGSCGYTAGAYPGLWAAIGTTYGGTGPTNFCLPDLRGRTPIGLTGTLPASTLGMVGGSLDAQPSVTFDPWTPTLTIPDHTFSWSIPDHSNAVSGYWCSTCASGTAIGAGSGAMVPSASNGTSRWETLNSGSAGGQTVSSEVAQATVNAAAPVPAQTVTLPKQNPPYEVVTYLINSGAPAESDISIGGDLAPGASRDIAVTVQPPTLPPSTMRGRFTLQIDLYDAICGCYFADAGSSPLEQPVTVTRVQQDALGLERYQQYDSVDTGVVSQAVNLFNGNNTLTFTPFQEPGIGLNTDVQLTYNSLENDSVSPMGNNVFLSISGLTPFGLPLDIHPNAADTAAGRTTHWIGFTDADGTYHTFTDPTGGGYYDAPPGVHLYLRATGSSDPAKYWALTKPDRTTFYFDQSGYPTRVEDGDGNALVFSETPVAPGDDAYGLEEHITAVTDQAGRQFAITYYDQTTATATAVRGKVASITDHVGHTLRFDYYDDGNLLRITEEGGTSADGSFLPDRSIILNYTDVAGDGPAVARASDRQSPDPATPQSSRLYSVTDFKGQETTFAYATADNSWRLVSTTDRAGATTTYSYAGGVTTVARPLSSPWTYAFDSSGRVTSITDPLNEQTTISWTPDNEVQRVTEPTGAYVEYAYNANGYLTDTWDELRDHQSIGYENLPVDSNDTSASWESGRTIPHISRVISVTQPEGEALGYGYTTTLHYPSGTVDHPDQITDPLGHATTFSYNSDGTLHSETLPDNGDGITRTTTYDSYDANGLPTHVTDAAGGITQASYAANGALQWTQDPNHASYGGGDATQYRSYNDYDSYGRLDQTSQPKSTKYQPGVLRWNDTTYDANDNVVATLNPHYGAGDSGVAPVTTTQYDLMDRPTVVTGPRGSADGGPVESETVYDAAGRVARSITPDGMLSSGVKAYSTETTYDALGRTASVSSYADDAFGNLDPSQTRTVNYCYDLAGDLRSITGPKGAASFTACPALAAPVSYSYTTAPFTTKFEYDAAHRQLGRITANGSDWGTYYDANGAVTMTTDPAGGETQYSYDLAGRKGEEAVLGAAGWATSVWTYDALGDVATYLSPRGFDRQGSGGSPSDYLTSYSYDALDRLVKTTLPSDANTPVSYIYNGYDADGNKTIVSLPTTSASFQPGTPATTIAYYDTGAIYSQQDPSDPRVHFDYTAEGQQASRIPEIAVALTTPTCVGGGGGGGVQPDCIVGSGPVGPPGSSPSMPLDMSKAMYWSYTPDGLVKSVRDLGGERASYSYDANGNELSVTQATGLTDASQTPLSITNTYDGFNQLVKTRNSTATAGSYTATLYSYDLDGMPTQLVGGRTEDGAGNQTAPGRTFNFTYNNLDQPITETDDYRTPAVASDDEQVSYSYTPTGLISSQTLSKANGSGGWTQEQSTTRTYFEDGLLKQLSNYNGAGTLIEQHTLSYTDSAGIYDDGNLVSDVFKRSVPAGTTASCTSATCTASWSYDAQDRLVSEADGTGKTSTFALDAPGNITKEVDKSGSTTTTTTSTYTGQQLQTQSVVVGSTTTNKQYIYDAEGNVVCVVTTGTNCPTAPSTALYSSNLYDYENRLDGYRSFMNSSGKPTGSATATTSTDYVIDPLNRNASEASTTSGATTTTKFAYVGLSSAVSTETLSGATNSARSYSYDASGNQLTYAVGSTRYSYMYDPHGSVSIVLNQSNVLEQTYGYTAYGSSNAALTKSASGFSANTNPYQYTGKRWDTGSASYNMGAREYDPSSGRYLQEDLYYGALDNLGLAQDPLTADRYLFTGANPINFIEVDGHYFQTGCQPGETCIPGDEGGGGCTTCGSGGAGGTGGAGGGSEGGSGNGPTCGANGDYCWPGGSGAGQGATGSPCAGDRCLLSSGQQSNGQPWPSSQGDNPSSLPVLTAGEAAELCQIVAGSSAIPYSGTALGRSASGMVWWCAPNDSWGNKTALFQAKPGIPGPAPYDPSKDYSSDSWGPFNNVMGSGYDELWNHASYDHDLCYGSQLYTRLQCDENFNSDMSAACVRAYSGYDELPCVEFAQTVYGVIRRYGGSHYKPRNSPSQP